MGRSNGLLIVYTGGKGKTTAALGMAVRATGYRRHTLILQFIGFRRGDPCLSAWGGSAVPCLCALLTAYRRACGHLRRWSGADNQGSGGRSQGARRTRSLRMLHRRRIHRRQIRGECVGPTKRGKGGKIMAGGRLADRAGLPLAACAAWASPRESRHVAPTIDSRFVIYLPRRLVGTAPTTLTRSTWNWPSWASR
jgi:hypothetical protein